MKKISHKLFTLCLVCIMAVGFCIPVYADEASPVISDLLSGSIPSSGGLSWDQPDGHKAFRVSIWNKCSETLKVTLIYPDGKKEECTLPAGVNTVICVNNNASAGKYEMDFITPSGVISGEYGVKWSTESFINDPSFVGEMSPVTGASNSGSIPSDGNIKWEQPDGHKAFHVSIWNKCSETLKVTLIYPDGKKKDFSLQAGVNEEICVDNNASAGEYEMEFSTTADTIAGEYGIRWSTVSLY